jgi:MtN3 and saliva related transmembrane protein
MSVNIIEFIGFLAGFCSSVSFVPQVYKTWKTKSAKDVSIQMFLVYTLAVTLWIIYGIANKNLPILITNAVVFVLSSAQIILKIKYDRAAS